MQTCSLAKTVLVLTVLTLSANHYVGAVPDPITTAIVTCSAAQPPAVSSLSPALTPTELTPVVIGLRLHNEIELQKLIAQQADPTSPNYRLWLTPIQFRDRFAPGASDEAVVAAYLAKYGINVTAVSSNHLIMQALVSKAQLEDLRSEVKRGLPANAAQVIQSISGLKIEASGKSKGQISPLSKNFPDKQGGYTPSDIATAYNFPNANNRLLKGTAFDGAGMTMAIVTAFGYHPQDVADFYAQCGIVHTGKITTIAIGGDTRVCELETTIDVEQATSQAPAADLQLYVAAGADFKNFELAFNQVVCDNLASVVSFSWGISETHLGSSEMLTTHQIFEEAAVQGIAVFASSGDDGAYGSIWENLSKPVLATNYPASDPLVTAVGGTSLNVHKDFKWKSESAWSGSGGGISIFWQRPLWQRGAGLPIFQPDQKRNSCDVSFDADPKTGYAIRFGGQWLVKGGTSCGTPNWAALWLLAQEAVKNRIGNSNAIIYAIANSNSYACLFHDITRGNNGGVVADGYKAGKGWDYPSGWGSPDGEGLLSWLISHH